MFANSSAIRSSPATTFLIRPFSTGIESEADLVTPVSLASASSLKPSSLPHFSETSVGTTGLNFTVLSCSPPMIRRARAMGQGAIDLGIGDGGLDLDRVHPGDRLADLVAGGSTALIRGSVCGSHLGFS
ncbi:MAG: hypothetical protein LJE59_05650 [Chromatiaceae bacterium]|nr:hypothetical protein [Chromatiaceae bacterium]